MTNPNRIYFGDNLPILERLDAESARLIYIDPPFNTGKQQRHTRLRTVPSETGDRTGFQGKRYTTIKIGSRAYLDCFDDISAFSNRGSNRPAAFSPPTERSISTLITVSRTTAKSSSTAFSGASAFSMK